MTFRHAARFTFLTYPQCSLTMDQLQAFLIEKGYATGIVCTELHEDGNAHLHAAIDYGKRHDVRNERYYDLEGFHPNIQRCRSWAAAVNYVKKDGEYMEWGTVL